MVTAGTSAFCVTAPCEETPLTCTLVSASVMSAYIQDKRVWELAGIRGKFPGGEVAASRIKLSSSVA